MATRGADNTGTCARRPSQRPVGRALLASPASAALAIDVKEAQQIHEPLERLYGPDVRPLELFGRRARPGWTVWGNRCGAKFSIRRQEMHPGR
jgi:N6-adenosine-specific RNA methylase IME4